MKDATDSTGRCARRAAMRLATMLLLAGLLLASGLATAAPVPVTLRASNEAAAASFGALLKHHGGDAVQLVSANHDGAVTLALGGDAFGAALAEPRHGPVLGVDIAAARVRDLVTSDCRCSAIRSGVPMSAQLAVLRELMPAARRIGVVMGPASAWRASLTAPDGVLLEALEVDPPRRLGPLLRRRLSDWDALLLPDDPELFGAGAAKLVLLTSYRQRVPVFGPGAEYVHAGSVASAWPDAAGLARASLARLRHWRRHRAWPAPDFAGHYALALNKHVARAYDLNLDPEARLSQRLETWP